MGQFNTYDEITALLIAAADIMLFADSSAGFQTKKMTVTEMDKKWATVVALAAASSGGWDFIQSGTPSASAADETWIDTDDGKVYKSSASGSGSWVLQFQFILNNTTIDQTINGDLNLTGGELLENKTILDLQVDPYYHFDRAAANIQFADDVNLDIGTSDASIICRFRTDFDFSGGLGPILNKRLTTGPGYQVYVNTSNKLTILINETGADVTIDSNSIVNDGEWHNVVALFDRSGNLSMYIDGSLQADTSALAGTTASNSEPLEIGADVTANEWFGGDIAGPIHLINSILSAAKSRSFSSNQQKAPDWRDEGGSNVEKISSWTNKDFDVFTSSGTDISVITSGANGDNCYSTLTIEKGKTYRLSFTLASSWSDGRVLSATNDNLSPSIDTILNGLASGVNSVEFIATADATFIGFLATTTGSKPALTNWSLIQLGATLVLDGKDFGHVQTGDSSGNKNPGLITTATLHNKPINQNYQDLYKTFATDNNTFDVPAGTVEMQIIIDVITLEAATTLRIGTTNGGQEVVADVATTSTGFIIATMVLDNFRAGDQLFIGSDGGAAWSALDFNFYVFYKVIEL